MLRVVVRRLVGGPRSRRYAPAAAIPQNTTDLVTGEKIGAKQVALNTMRGTRAKSWRVTSARKPAFSGRGRIPVFLELPSRLTARPGCFPQVLR